MFPPGFTRLFSDVAAGKCFITLAELASRLELKSELGVLAQVIRIREVLEIHGLEIVPDVNKGEFESVRSLQFKSVRVGALDRLMEDLKGDEKADVEFKSTLVFDVKLYENQVPRPKVTECRSEKVLYASLKSVAAFINTEGGRLYIGIADDKSALGLQQDFQIPCTRNRDKWEQFFRQSLEASFKDGQVVNDHVRLDYIDYLGVLIACASVEPRRSLSFIKSERRYVVYRRQGNRTVEVAITDFEEFLRKRWGLDDHRSYAYRSSFPDM
jgi:hypothetical protein